MLSAPVPDSAVIGDVDDLVNQKLRALQRRLTATETSVRIVVTPERMVIDEARRAWTELSLFAVPCDAVVINRLLPEEAVGEAFFRDWGRVQEERRREVEDLFAPLPLLAAPLQDDEVTGLERLTAHGRQIFDGLDPDATLCRAPRVRFRRDGAEYLAVVPLPGADPARLELIKIEDELTITAGHRRRSLKLPRRLGPLSLASARLEGPALVVRFAADAAGAGRA